MSEQFWLVNVVISPLAGVVGGLLGSAPFARTPLAQRLGLSVGTALSIVLSQFDTRVIGGNILIGMVPLAKLLDPLALSAGLAAAIGLMLTLFGQEHLRAGRGQVTINNIDSNVFISYRRSDSLDVTGRIYDQLKRRLPGCRVFRDLNSMPLGADFRAHINATLGMCRVCLVIIGPTWLNVRGEQQRRLYEPRDHVRREIEAAQANKLFIIPVLISGAVMPKEAELPKSIRFLVYRTATVVRPDPDFQNDLDRLVTAIVEYL